MTAVNYRAMRAYDPRLVREAVASGVYSPDLDGDGVVTDDERRAFALLVALTKAEERRAGAHERPGRERHSHTCGCPLCL